MKLLGGFSTMSIDPRMMNVTSPIADRRRRLLTRTDPRFATRAPPMDLEQK